MLSWRHYPFLMIRSATANDSGEIAGIYNYYILNTHSTFETEPVSDSEMATRISNVQNELNLPWIVALSDEKVLGYAYATKWKARAAYVKTVETTVYLHHDAFGKGLGSQLYREMIEQLRAANYHVLLGGIALPNDPSIALHEKLGYVKVGQLQEVGRKFDRWIDVGYWELKL